MKSQQKKTKPLFLHKILVMIDFSKRLMVWYQVNGRELPWRQTTDPYQIWISEIILQQTQVKQGMDYYHRFIRRFPNVQALASASEEEVLRLWQGLGYYSRARNLHAAAKTVVTEYNGQFPDQYETIIQLKGIGPYTAAAVASFAYNLQHAVVDGNVYRFLSRLFGIDFPIDSTAGKKHFHNLAQQLLNKEEPGMHNQAVMEMGALQCKPVNPDCSVCPFVDDCVAFTTGKVQMFPVKEKKIRQRHRYFSYLFILDKDQLVIQKREGSDIWQNLYELPLIESDKPLSLKQLKIRMADRAGHVKLLDEKKHILSHQVIHTRFYLVPQHGVEGKEKSSGMKVPIEDLKHYPFPQLIVNFLNKQGLMNDQ